MLHSHCSVLWFLCIISLSLIQCTIVQVKIHSRTYKHPQDCCIILLSVFLQTVLYLPDIQTVNAYRSGLLLETMERIHLKGRISFLFKSAFKEASFVACQGVFLSPDDLQKDHQIDVMCSPPHSKAPKLDEMSS